MATSSATQQPAVRSGLQRLGQLPANEQDASVATLGNLFDGFQRRDAEKLTGVYAEDAGRVNAFGSVKQGADVIDYLRRV